MRSYAEFCAIAKSLDVVGDRWTLLIVRELALKGPSRYTDLRNGLPGIATNLLAARLRELEQTGVIASEEAPPPIATTLFRLTDRGEQLRPVLEDLTRWGLPLMTEQKPDDAVQSHWLAWALELMLTDHRPDLPPITVELRTADQPITIRVGEGNVRAAAGSVEDADAIVTGEPRPIVGLLIGMLDMTAAAAAGVAYDGPPDALERIRPIPAAPTAPA